MDETFLTFTKLIEDVVPSISHKITFDDAILLSMIILYYFLIINSQFDVSYSENFNYKIGTND